LDFTGARDDGVAVASAGACAIICTSYKTYNHLTIHFFHARCPSCRPTNSIRALKAPDMTVEYGLSTQVVIRHLQVKQGKFASQRKNVLPLRHVTSSQHIGSFQLGADEPWFC